MKISFDFDGCLGELKSVQSLCRSMQHANQIAFPAKPFNLVIITTRFEKVWKENHNFLHFIQDLGFTIDDVIFTNGIDKVHKIVELGIEMHFDDDNIEIELINEVKPGVGVLVGLEV